MDFIKRFLAALAILAIAVTVSVITTVFARQLSLLGLCFALGIVCTLCIVIMMESFKD